MYLVRFIHGRFATNSTTPRLFRRDIFPNTLSLATPAGMAWYQIFQDGPEYEARRNKPSFTPPDLSLKDIHNAVPKHLLERNTLKSLLYVFRHITFTYTFYVLATHIDDVISLSSTRFGIKFGQIFIRMSCWSMYWFWQSLGFAGMWSLGHEAGHEALSPVRFINDLIGLPLHAFILVPYYSWRVTHLTHHKATNNLERDETYIPPTRLDFKLPDGKVAVAMDYKDILEDTPAFTLFKLVMRQFLGFQLYLFHNRKGNPKYPPWTSHYLPSSQIFKLEHRNSIILSNVSICTMLAIIGSYVYSVGWTAAWKYYFVPWFLANNWIVTFTYLQHSDPTIPYYRKDQWTFARGALATVDRPFFGWIGRVFLHNIAHDHVAHHFFSMVPFYNQPEVTEAIRPVLGEYYNYDSSNAFYSLWRSFTQCTFVEPDGDVVFCKNQRGQAVREYRT